MKKSLYIEGQNTLEGKVDISGSKNAAIPCLAASLLTEQTVILNNIPLIKDMDLTEQHAWDTGLMRIRTTK